MVIKAAISNIAWSKECDENIFEILRKEEFQAIEIAPTRIISEKPYEHLQEAKEFAQSLKTKYGLDICSIQSIWYGRNENMFNSKEEREILYEHTKKAILFSETVNAGNLVFGCPKNRCIKKESDYNVAVEFFKKLGDYALKHNTVLAIEANPIIYNTNFINTTMQAVEFIKDIDSDGIKLNLDMGTIIANQENFEVDSDNIKIINHVHLSEPFLKKIKKRQISQKIISQLLKNNYMGYISIEMGLVQDKNDIIESIDILKSMIYK